MSERIMLLLTEVFCQLDSYHADETDITFLR